MKQPIVRVRFAPSPTGHLHVGGLRTALFNYLFAKHTNGTYVLRCEDTDVGRSTAEFFASQMSSFEWVGLMPDEPVVIQSSRFSEHFKVVDRLIAEKKAYKCFCTEDELAVRLGKKEGEHDGVRYDRYCFNNPQVAHQRATFVIRFSMPSEDQQVYSFDDLIRGKISFQSDQYDDFIIVRSDGVPVYNLVVVIDDAFMRITHVIRGEEHIGNTPKQIAIYKACGYTIPAFAHLPMILGSSGAKLSKRDGATSVNDYKADGYLPQALLNYLARLGWSYRDQEVFTMNELIDYFTLESVGKKGAIFDREKLNWMNGMYLKAASASFLYEYMQNQLGYQLQELCASWSRDKIESAIALVKDRVVTVKELKDELSGLYGNFALAKTDITDEMKRYVGIVKEHFLKGVIAAHIVKEVAKQEGVPMVLVAQPVRFALTGRLHGPGVGDVLNLLTKDEVLERLKKLEDA